MISARDKPFVIFEAPSVLGLFPKGVEGLPEALLAAGLAERLGAKRAGRVEPPVYNAERDSKTSLLNPQGIAAYSIALADAVGQSLAMATVPVVLGGDCSILLGCLLALRRRGRYGLLFLDGHADFYQPEAGAQRRGGINGPRARHRARPGYCHRSRGSAAIGP